ncbi:hypothetical protein ISO66_02015 [Morganella morganii subsp. morganii]|uniref:hypothetical protein n=1 Tax=Morganella morganii TaxID=582 RepID=UPI001BDB0438|nr:hypothetical protein [Morganella morganii]MBT0332130.1 hypothetical protein [Morganella morganii subsp. morganii]
MADIYDFIVRMDLDAMSTDELRSLKSVSSDTCDGLLSGLKTMGECAFWASANEDYSDEQAKDDLRRIGESLMYLPRLIDAMRFTEDEAQLKIYQREGFPYTEVNNGKH